MAPPTLATPANMSEFRRRNPVPRYGGALAYSPTTGEQYSASAGDYWNRPADEPLLDSDSAPMLLVVKHTTYADALA